MTIIKLSKLIVGSSLLFLFASAFAQSSSDDQADVWELVEAEWNASEDGDRKWIQTHLSEDFTGWDSEYPAPRNKDSMKMWNDFGAKMGKLVAHELYPLSIVIHDDVAVAHYMYSSAFENKDGDVERSSGRYTDVLVRIDDGWKFFAWHGGDD